MSDLFVGEKEALAVRFEEAQARIERAKAILEQKIAEYRDVAQIPNDFQEALDALKGKNES